MSSNLHAASSQWANRPADERFWALSDMRAACTVARNNSVGAVAPMSSLSATVIGDEVGLVGTSNVPAKFTNYAFGQFCANVGAPATYLRSLPAQVATDCLNVGLARKADTSDRHLLFHKNGGLTLRASLSDVYDRVWDDDVCQMLEGLDGWRTPAGLYSGHGESRIATPEDILPGQINIGAGSKIGPAGLYASDHDLFAFLVAPDRVIKGGSGGGSLMRGIFVRNSEVGDSSLSMTFFLMDAVCGNHIVWGATGVHELKVRHAGRNTARKAFHGFETELRKYRDGAAEEEAGIEAAKKYVLGVSKEECLNAILKYAKGHSLELSKERVSSALDCAEEHETWYGNPRTVWAAVAGLTHTSQRTGFADDRAKIDKAAGKLMNMAF